MIIVSQNALKYEIGFPDDCVFRINLAWCDSLDELNKILERENRIGLYKDCLKFLRTRVDLDLALFKDDIWSH